MISSNANIDNRVVQNGIDPVQLVEIDGDTDWYFSTQTLTSGMGTGYDNYKTNIIDISNIDRRSNNNNFGVAIVSDVDIALQNTDPIISNDIPADFVSIVNKKVIIKTGFLKTSAGAAFPLTDFIVTYTGYVRIPEWNNKELVLGTVDASFIRNKTIPTTVISSNDSDSVPARSVNKPYPMTFGVIDRAKGYLVKQSSNQEVFFDRGGQDLKALNNAYTYISSDESFALITFESSSSVFLYTVKTNKEGIDFTNNGTSSSGVLELSYELVPVEISGTAFVVDPEDAIDGDSSTASESAPDAEDTDSIVWSFTFQGFPDYTTKIDQAALLIKCNIDPGTQADSRFTFFWNLSASTTNITEIILTTVSPSDITSFNNYDDKKGYEKIISTSITFENTVDSVGTLSYTNTASVGIMDQLFLNEFMVLLDASTDLSSADYYADIEGRVFGAGWTGKTSTDMIENPADVINAIYRQELGVAGSDIDEDSFDDAITYLSGWKFAGQILELEDSKLVIDRLCEQSTLRNYKRNDDREAVKARDVSTSVDIAFDVSNSRDRKFKKTSPDKVYNEFRIKYNKNYATGNYEGEKFVTATDDNFTSDGAAYRTKCSTASSSYGAVNPLIIEADFIRDEATAEMLCKAKADYRSIDHYEGTLSCSINDGLLLEQYDVCTIDDAWLPTEVRGANGKFEILDIFPDAQNIRYKLKVESLD